MCAKVRSVVTIYLPFDKDHVTSRTLFLGSGGGGGGGAGNFQNN